MNQTWIEPSINVNLHKRHDPIYEIESNLQNISCYLEAAQNFKFGQGHEGEFSLELFFCQL